MLSFLVKTKKSAGVPVTPAVHRLIQRANDARDRGAWDDAAEHYREAVTADPNLAHIWIQLGHAEKGKRRFGQAEAAYVRAAMLQPHQAEPLLHLGHLYKLMGNPTSATRSYVGAARLDPTNENVIEELQKFVFDTAPFARTDLLTLLRDAVFGNLPNHAARSDTSDASGRAILFDVSSLVAASIAGRNFSDIGLISDVILSTLNTSLDRPVAMCAHVVGHSRWLGITPAQLDRIVASGRSGRPTGPAAQSDSVSDLDLGFLLSDALEISTGALLVDLDADHAPADHALFVQDMRVHHGIRYLAFGKAIAPELARQASGIRQQSGASVTEDMVRAAIDEPVFENLSSYHTQTRLARIERLGNFEAGRNFRAGLGWLPLEDWGCWATMPGGELEIALPEVVEPRLYLRLKALPADKTRYLISLPDGRRISGEIESGQYKWLFVDDLPVVEGVLRLRIGGENSKLVDVEGSTRKLPAMVGVAGFYICERQDRVARLALLEAATLSDLERLY